METTKDVPIEFGSVSATTLLDAKAQLEQAMGVNETTPQIGGVPDEVDLMWLCHHPDHSLKMVDIMGDGVCVPMIVDENGDGPVIPVEEETP